MFQAHDSSGSLKNEQIHPSHIDSPSLLDNQMGSVVKCGVMADITRNWDRIERRSQSRKAIM